MSSSDFEKLVNNCVNDLVMYNSDILDTIFTNPNLTNIFLKHNTLKSILFDYIITTKNKTFYEIVELFKNDFIDRYNTFKFYNGKFTDIDIKKLNESSEGKKMLNTILIFNTKKTSNEEFNDIFNFIKDFDIITFNFNDIFNPIILNNIHNDYNFNFMKIYEHNDKYKTIYADNRHTYTKPEVMYSKLELMDNYILKYNDDSMLFKKWFYMLLSYVNSKNDLSFKQLLNIFQNFNIVFYHKLIYPNDKDANLITYIYFKSDRVYRPNLRYTYNITGKTHDEKIQYLKTLNNENKGNFKEFKTEIISDDKGIYISTLNYKPEDIIKHCQDLINLKKYETLAYYIFNSQFLNRSTCLFGYFVYYYFTKKILKSLYFDIIAITSQYAYFKCVLDDTNNYVIDELEKINVITLDNIIDLIN